MLKFYSYSRIALISIIVILSVLTTAYCYKLENAQETEETVTEQVVSEMATSSAAQSADRLLKS